MPRLSNIEKLARDICWADIPKGERMGFTKAAYWRGLGTHWREGNIEKAKWLVFIVKKLKPIRVLAMVDFK